MEYLRDTLEALAKANVKYLKCYDGAPLQELHHVDGGGAFLGQKERNKFQLNSAARSAKRRPCKMPAATELLLVPPSSAGKVAPQRCSHWINVAVCHVSDGANNEIQSFDA